MSHKDPHSQYYERLNTFLGATNEESERGRVLVAASLIEERLEEILFRRFDAMLQASGYIAMGGQIIDATVVAALKQRNTEDEKRTQRKAHSGGVARPAREIDLLAVGCPALTVTAAELGAPDSPGRVC